MKLIAGIVIFIALALTTTALAQEQIVLLDQEGSGGFESAGSFLGNGWTVENGGEANRWEVGTANPPGPFYGLRSAYISTDGGGTWGFDTTRSSIVHFYRNIMIPQDAEEVLLLFQFRGAVDFFNQLFVYAVPPNTPIVAGISLPFEPLRLVYPTLNFYKKSIQLLQVTPGMEIRLVFSWVNTAGGLQPPIAIDDIDVSYTRRNPLKKDFSWQNPKPQGNHLNGVVPLNPTTAIATGDFGTVGKTTDAGETWDFKSRLNGLTGNIVSPITANGKVYIIAQPNNFLMSSDGGTTFIPQSQIDNGTVTIYSIANQPGTDNFVAAGGNGQTGGNGKIFGSTDGGITWSNVHNVNNTVLQDIEYTGTGSAEIIAGGLFGVIVRSTDTRANFETIPSAFSNDVNDIAVDPSDSSGNTIYTATAGGGVWKTTNFLTNDPNGPVWNQVFGANQTVRDINMIDGQVGTAVGNGSSNGIIFSTIDGWNSVTTTDLGAGDFPFGVAHYTPDKLTLVGRSGLIVNGFPISYASSSLINANINDVEFIKFINTDGKQSYEYGFAVSSGGVVLATTNKGNEWTPLQSGVNAFLNAVTAKGYPPENILVVGSGGHVRSTNGGSTFKPMTIAPTGSFYDVKYTGTNSAVTVGDSGKIYSTSNLGASWDLQQSGITNRLLGIDFDYYESQFKNRRIRTGSDTLFGIAVGQSGRILRTFDGGINWETKNSPVNTSLFAVDVVDRLTAFAVGSVGVFIRTTDGGETWTQHATNFLGTINSLSFIGPTIGIISTSTGLLLRTLDAGEHWDTLGSITNSNLLDVQMFDPYSATAVGGSGTIMHAEPDSIIVLGIKEEHQNGLLPSQIVLEQNYPNPFNPNTTIEFSLPRQSHVLLALYNALGTEIKVLLDGQFPPGRHKARWNSLDHPSGVYFYRLQTNSFRETRKLILLR